MTSVPIDDALTAESNTESAWKRGLKDCAAGSVGGILQVLAGQPFDTIKVRMQTQPLPVPGQSPLYAGPLDCLQKTIKNEGFLGLYKGTLTPLLGIGVCSSIQFVVLEHMKRQFSSRKLVSGPLSSAELFFSGATAGVANSVVSGPVEHIRTRLQVQTGAKGSGTGPVYNGPIDCIRKIYGDHGLKGVYKGQSATILREFVGYGVYFTTYEHLMQRAMRKEGKQRHELSTWNVVGFGALSGYVLWLIIYPIDAVKSKLQTDGLTPTSQKYNSLVDCARKTFRNEGLAGFYRGFVPCILRAAPANAATFLGFEVAMRFLQ